MNVNVGWRNLMKTGFVWTLAVALGIACSANIEAASAKPAKQSSSEPAAKTDPGEWKKILEAAKKEGKIVLFGSPGEAWRKSMVDMFQQEYPEISVEFSAGAGRNFWPRIRQERGLGKKLWDLRTGGVDALGMEAKRDGFLAPIRPLLLPEIADDSKWFWGLDEAFNDREKKYILGFTSYVQPSVFFNADFIKESDLKSTEQLLDPKFRGKIVITTPTGGASQKSLAHMAFMYGKNFILDLLSKQDVIVTDDNRQQVEWVVRGKYPIAIGLPTALLVPYAKQGLGKNLLTLEDKIIRITNGSGIINFLEGAPHPNAAKVYINWLLSQKTQILISQNTKTNSGRTDVPVVDKGTAIDLAKLNKYRNGDKEVNHEFADSLLPMIKEALKQ